jgi:hypothetical protein
MVKKEKEVVKPVIHKFDVKMVSVDGTSRIQAFVEAVSAKEAEEIFLNTAGHRFHLREPGYSKKITLIS